MKKLKLSEASNNSLSELRTLYARIECDIDYFKHVGEYVPKSFEDKLKQVSDAVDKEIERRGF